MCPVCAVLYDRISLIQMCFFVRIIYSLCSIKMSPTDCLLGLLLRPLHRTTLPSGCSFVMMASGFECVYACICVCVCVCVRGQWGVRLLIIR